MEIPAFLQRKVRKTLRRARNATEITAAARRSRKQVGRKITQFRKEQGLTVATSSQAATVIANLHRDLQAAKEELDAARERVQELEDQNELLQEEVDSMNAHEAELDEPAPDEGGSERGGFPDLDEMEDLISGPLPDPTLPLR